MEKEKLESMLIDYIDGLLSESDRLQVEKMIAEDAGIKTLLEQLRDVMNGLDRAGALQPSENLRANFLKDLQQLEQENRPQGRQVFFSPMVMRMAAAVALVISGVAIGYWINRNNQQEAEMLALRKQMDEMKMMMMAKLDNDQSASQRMVGISVAYQLEVADDEIVNALVKRMNEDENTNVRLAALEALSKFVNETKVRQALIQSLHTQKDPMVQISLIQLMVKMKEKGIVKELEEIADDEKTLKPVKDEAYKGILKLS